MTSPVDRTTLDLDDGGLRAVASDEGHQLVIRGARRIRNAAVRFAPRGRTGDLKRSIKTRITREPDGDTRAEVFSTAPYARFVHDGTRPHRIEPRRRGGVLRFPGSGGARGVVFATYANHPGTRANPFLTRALESVASTAGFAREG